MSRFKRLGPTAIAAAGTGVGLATFGVGRASPESHRQIESEDSPPPRSKGYFGSSLQLSTAVTLAGESLLPHHHDFPKTAANIGIGVAQRVIGIAGAAYYGQKYAKDGELGDLLKAGGYGAFAVHGALRGLQSTKPHPVATPAVGALAGFAKSLASGPIEAVGYAADALANAGEAGHGVAKSKSRLSPLVPGIDLKTIVRSQRVGAAALGVGAMYQIYKNGRDHED
jgi:hypothetical protein